MTGLVASAVLFAAYMVKHLSGAKENVVLKDKVDDVRMQGVKEGGWSSRMTFGNYLLLTTTKRRNHIDCGRLLHGHPRLPRARLRPQFERCDLE